MTNLRTTDSGGNRERGWRALSQGSLLPRYPAERLYESRVSAGDAAVWSVSRADPSGSGIELPGEERDFDLSAASLRASSGDLRAFVDVLADRLDRAFPGRVN